MPELRYKLLTRLLAFDNGSDTYEKFRVDIGKIAVRYEENPYHVMLSVLMAGLERIRENLNKAERCALACAAKVKKMAEETGMPEELLHAIIMNNDELAKELVRKTNAEVN